MDETEPTAAEIKVREAGNKYLLAASDQVYLAMAAKMDEAGGMPQAQTARVLPLDPGELKDGRKFQIMPQGRVQGAYKTLLLEAIAAGHVQHLSQAEFDLVKPDPTGI
jgi:hypothetical protein